MTISHLIVVSTLLKRDLRVASVSAWPAHLPPRPRLRAYRTDPQRPRSAGASRGVSVGSMARAWRGGGARQLAPSRSLGTCRSLFCVLVGDSDALAGGQKRPFARGSGRERPSLPRFGPWALSIISAAKARLFPL